MDIITSTLTEESNKKYSIFDNSEIIPTCIDTDFICEVTQEIICEPMLAEDGFIYEKSVIEEWIQKSETNKISLKSPRTNMPMGKKIIYSIQHKNMIDNFISANPRFIKFQHVNDMTYMKNKQTIITILVNQNYEELLKYKDFIINDRPDRSETFIMKIVQKCARDGNKSFDHVIIHVLENCSDINVPGYDGVRIIQYLCYYCSPELIIYICKNAAKLGIEFDFAVQRHYCPILMYMNYKNENIATNSETIKHLIQATNNIDSCYDQGSSSVLRQLVKYSDLENIQLYYNKFGISPRDNISELVTTAVNRNDDNGAGAGIAQFLLDMIPVINNVVDDEVPEINNEVVEELVVNNNVVVEEPVVNNVVVIQEPVVNNNVVIQEPVVNNNVVIQEPVVNNNVVIQEPVVNNNVVIEEPEVINNVGILRVLQVLEDMSALENNEVAIAINENSESDIDNDSSEYTRSSSEGSSEDSSEDSSEGSSEGSGEGSSEGSGEGSSEGSMTDSNPDSGSCSGSGSDSEIISDDEHHIYYNNINNINDNNNYIRLNNILNQLVNTYEYDDHGFIV
jgi:uncharacterized membrane protein YgcG